MKLNAVLVGVASVMLLPGCAQVVQSVSGVTLDSRLIENTIEEGVLDQSGVSVVAECPDSLSGQPGDVRQCLVTDDLGNKALVDITIQNMQGFITWELRD